MAEAYRIELPYETEDDKRCVEDFKTALDEVLMYERTECPFRRGFQVDIPTEQVSPLPVKKLVRSNSKARKWEFDEIWRPEGAEKPSPMDWRKMPSSRRRSSGISTRESEDDGRLSEMGSDETLSTRPTSKSIAENEPYVNSQVRRLESVRSVTGPPKYTFRNEDPVVSDEVGEHSDTTSERGNSTGFLPAGVLTQASPGVDENIARLEHEAGHRGIAAPSLLKRKSSSRNLRSSLAQPSSMEDDQPSSLRKSHTASTEAEDEQAICQAGQARKDEELSTEDLTMSVLNKSCLQNIRPATETVFEADFGSNEAQGYSSEIHEPQALPNNIEQKATPKEHATIINKAEMIPEQKQIMHDLRQNVLRGAPVSPLLNQHGENDSNKQVEVDVAPSVPSEGGVDTPSEDGNAQNQVFEEVKSTDRQFNKHTANDPSAITLDSCSSEPNPNIPTMAPPVTMLPDFPANIAETATSQGSSTTLQKSPAEESKPALKEYDITTSKQNCLQKPVTPIVAPAPHRPDDSHDHTSEHPPAHLTTPLTTTFPELRQRPSQTLRGFRASRHALPSLTPTPLEEDPPPSYLFDDQPLAFNVNPTLASTLSLLTGPPSGLLTLLLHMARALRESSARGVQAVVQTGKERGRERSKSVPGEWVSDDEDDYGVPLGVGDDAKRRREVWSKDVKLDTEA